jgi:hypothetical protein
MKEENYVKSEAAHKRMNERVTEGWDERKRRQKIGEKKRKVAEKTNS